MGGGSGTAHRCAVPLPPPNRVTPNVLQFEKFRPGAPRRPRFVCRKFFNCQRARPRPRLAAAPVLGPPLAVSKTPVLGPPRRRPRGHPNVLQFERFKPRTPGRPRFVCRKFFNCRRARPRPRLAAAPVLGAPFGGFQDARFGGPPRRCPRGHPTVLQFERFKNGNMLCSPRNTACFAFLHNARMWKKCKNRRDDPHFAQPKG